MFKAWGIGCDSNSFLTAIFCSRAALGRLGMGPNWDSWILRIYKLGGKCTEDIRENTWKTVSQSSSPEAKKRNMTWLFQCHGNQGHMFSRFQVPWKPAWFKGVSWCPRKRQDIADDFELWLLRPLDGHFGFGCSGEEQIEQKTQRPHPKCCEQIRKWR